MTAPTPLPAQQAAPAHPAPGYASPIPVVRTHIGHAIASEWTKIRTVRSTVWTLLSMFVVTLGIGTLYALSLSGEDYVGMPLLAGGFFGLMLGQLGIITLGVLVISSEYGTGMMRTTLTACPRRGRVLTAKAIVFFLLAFLMTLAAAVPTALVQLAVLSDQEVPSYAVDDAVMEDSIVDGEVVASTDQVLGATLGAALYVALLGLLALAVGALLRHSAGAITVMLGVVLLPLLTALFLFGESVADLRDALIEYSPLNGLASLYGIPMMGDELDSGWPLLGLLALVTGGTLAAAFARLNAGDA
ncbi:ABC transporter permease [Streptomyces radicis]|uniref:ABC transporter permease n=1 Tax=Streptomyces radicis TaxID=1750517 RepID=A0A3A9W9P2_9ACTN|nr:ABC transporter permease [Streptomyces radicis]RKN09352.1 ABC transporter permease [Streptomyces radicis]RKN23050.1 ABC transporter permease [Streptomyces radicis]